MSVTKTGRFISCLLMLAALSCNHKPGKNKQLFVAPDASIKCIDIDGKTFYDISKALPNLSNQTSAYWDNYFSAFSGKMKYLPSDSLLPGIYPMSEFSTRMAYSVNWGSVDKTKTREIVDILESKKGKTGTTIKWESIIKGQFFFPDRGISLTVEIPFCYRYNCLTRTYEYFPSAENSNTCSLAMTGPALGELNFPMRQIYNFSSDENVPNDYNGWAEGAIMITERRHWLEFANKRMKFLYGPAPVLKQAISDAQAEYNIKAMSRTSELYQVRLTIRFKTPAELAKIDPGKTVDAGANPNDFPAPLYILTLKGEFLGIHHN